MMLLLRPNRTKKAPMIEVMMQTAQTASGSTIIEDSTAAPRKKIAASTMVATVVTA